MDQDVVVDRLWMEVSGGRALTTRCAQRALFSTEL